MQFKFIKPMCCFLVVSFPLIFFGYGSDNDTYAVLSAGKSTWENLLPQMSRNPGYWLYEAMVFWINRLGGYILVNGVTLAVSVFVLYRFYSLSVCQNVSNPILLTLCLAFNPWFLIAATSTMDYIWALLFIVISIECASKDKYLIAGILSGIASGFRLGSTFTLAFAFIFSLFTAGIKVSLKGYFILGCTALALIILLYLPSWLIYDRSLFFLKGHLGDPSLWTLKMHAGRFFYKIIHLFGLPSFVVIIVALVSFALKHEGQINKNKFIMAGVGASFGTLVLFARYPIEISYLLPFLFFSLLLLGVYLGNNGRKYLIAILVTTISYSFVNISIAKPNVPNQATDASFGLFINPGILVKDISFRLRLIDCKSFKCYSVNNLVE